MTTLLIAFYLAILTFYLGVLIYALPIPLSGLKRWGPRLINDAFFIAALTSSIKLIIDFTDYIRSVLGGDWDNFFFLVKGVMIFRSLFILALSSTIASATKILPGFSRVVSPYLNILTTSLYFLTLMYFLGVVVYYGVATLSSLGVTLMAIPFRIARNAGAFLLSFALVLYVALPLYPHFLSLLVLPLPRTSLNLVTVYGDVKNFLGHKIYNGYLGVKVGEEYIGPARLGIDGKMAIFIPRDYMDKPATIYFDVSGHRFYTNVSGEPLATLCKYTFSVYMCRIDIEVKGLIHYSKGIALHIHPPPVSVDNIYETSNSVILTLTTDTDTKLYISAVEAYTINAIIVDGVKEVNVDMYKAYEWNWYGIKGVTYVISLSSGHHEICIEFDVKSTEDLEPSVEDLYPGKLFQRDISLLEILDFLSSSAYLDIISSILYISLLFSASYGLSKVLGGGARLRLTP
jgi:hypothetical protein